MNISSRLRKRRNSSENAQFIDAAVSKGENDQPTIFAISDDEDELISKKKQQSGHAGSASGNRSDGEHALSPSASLKRQKTKQIRKNQKRSATISESSLDSLSGSAEETVDIKCVICLDQPDVQGTLNSCKHIFCFECIKQWSSTSNTCPSCRNKFNTITKKDINNSKMKPQKIRVKNVDQRVHDENDYGFLVSDEEDEEDFYDYNDGFVVWDDEEEDSDEELVPDQDIFPMLFHFLARGLNAARAPPIVDLTEDTVIEEEEESVEEHLHSSRPTNHTSNNTEGNSTTRVTRRRAAVDDNNILNNLRATRQGPVRDTFAVPPRNSHRHNIHPRVLRPQLPTPLTLEELNNTSWRPSQPRSQRRSPGNQ